MVPYTTVAWNIGMSTKNGKTDITNQSDEP